MRRVDQDALRRALEMAKAQSPGRREQIDAKLADEPWENVAAFAASCSSRATCISSHGNVRHAMPVRRRTAATMRTLRKRSP